MNEPLAALQSIRNFIIDLDGTLLRSGQLVPGAAELLRHVAGRYAIVSNNSTDTAKSLCHLLRNLNLDVEPKRLVLAGEQTIRFVAERYSRTRILLISSSIIRRYARQHDLNLVDRDADFVVLARDRKFNYDTLSRAVDELHRGARLIVTNPDLTHPGRDGKVVPETGALLKAIAACTEITPLHIIGKPEETLFLEGMKRLDAHPRDTLVIGDNPLTDGIGANKLGMRHVLVKAMTPFDGLTAGLQQSLVSVSALAKSIALEG